LDVFLLDSQLLKPRSFNTGRVNLIMIGGPRVVPVGVQGGKSELAAVPVLPAAAAIEDGFIPDVESTLLY